MPLVHINEVVKQFRFYVNGLDTEVRGEIRKQVAPTAPYPYQWWISHHYRPSATAVGIYYPSRTTADSAEEAEAMLMAYASNFTAEFGVAEN